MARKAGLEAHQQWMSDNKARQALSRVLGTLGDEFESLRARTPDQTESEWDSTGWCTHDRNEGEESWCEACGLSSPSDFEAALDAQRVRCLELAAQWSRVARAIGEFMKLGPIDRLAGIAAERKLKAQRAAKASVESRRKKKEAQERELLEKLKKKYGAT